MNKKTISASLLLATIIICGTWIYRSQFGEPEIDVDIYRALGTVTADETVKLLGNKGKIVLIAWDSSQSEMPTQEAQLASFQKALKKFPQLAIMATEKVARNPMQMMATGGAIPADQLLKIIKAHPDAAAVVLFLAFPNLLPEERSAINGRTKVVVISGCNPGYKKLLTDQVIHLAIVPQFNRTQPNHAPRTMQESFDQNYLVVTPERAGNLPY